MLSSRILSKNILQYSKRTFRILSISRNENNETPKEHQEKSTVDAKKLEEDLKECNEKLSKSVEQIADFKDKYVRALAEAENTRVRMRKQVDDAKIFGIQGFCKDLLGIADTLHLAIKNTKVDVMDNEKDERVKELAGKVKAIYSGLQMTESIMLKTFEKHGLSRIQANEGDKFDPNIHEAVFQAPIPDKKSGTICMVNQVGYKLHDRVIRAAQVGVVQ
jgi:molecular chaperone GrpE